MTRIFDGPASFDLFQDGDDRVPGESGFAHGDLLEGQIQYVGRSLKVNGRFTGMLAKNQRQAQDVNLGKM
ncbi:hypothetical protein [Pantoea ananatis]|uniref:hypothetical protein n=1 Tax=Pantoea ananas TaxID=553 RepID=UPI0021F6F3F9|nr:hypothetical protein [Pantoea ananatis]MDS7719634.1 hypothetical protein [Pantoea ananatis]